MQNQLAAERQPQQQAPANRDSASLGGGTARRDTTGAKPDSAKTAAGGTTMTTPDGRTIQLPPGVTEAQIRSAFQKRMSGQDLTPAEQNAMAAMRQMMMRAGGGGGQGGGASRRNAGEPSSYIVFTLKKGKPTPVQIRTGLTDLDYIEVLSGLQLFVDHQEVTAPGRLEGLLNQLMHILFAALHTQYALSFATLEVFVLGLGLGWLRVRAASVVPGMVTHAGYDIAVGFLSLIAK